MEVAVPYLTNVVISLAIFGFGISLYRSKNKLLGSILMMVSVMSTLLMYHYKVNIFYL